MHGRLGQGIMRGQWLDPNLSLQSQHLDALCPTPCCPSYDPLPQNFSDVFPHLVTATNVPKLVKIEDVSRSGATSWEIWDVR